MNKPDIPALSVVIPTRNRPKRLRLTLDGLAAQVQAPEEIVIVDASDDANEIVRLNAEYGMRFACFKAVRAAARGAAVQRNQGVALATGELIGFCDDDIDFETNCIAGLREFLIAHPAFGGVSATVTNQAPQGFGKATRAVVGLMDVNRGRPLDGRVIGPALNFLPALKDQVTGPCESEWLNTTCTVYRRHLLPVPPFESQFRGYSMLEDVCLSTRVGRQARLAVLRDARIFHDTQPGDHKRNVAALARMSVENRYYVATRVLGQSCTVTWLQLALWQTFCSAAGLRRPDRAWLMSNWGALVALLRLPFHRR